MTANERITSCKACGREVSRAAKLCPHCGQKKPGKKPEETPNIVIYIGAGMFVFTVLLNLIIQPPARPTVNPNPKIASYAVDIMAPKQYPKTYKKWGKDGMERINKLFEPAAKRASLQPTCDQVEMVSLSDSKSRPPNIIVIFANCKNGRQFHMTEGVISNFIHSAHKQ